MAAFGLHLGTCSACLAVYRDGKTNVVANDLGDRVTPAVVAFTDQEISVGESAKQAIIRNASNTVSHVKRLIGCRMDGPQVKEFVQSSSATVANAHGSPVFEVEHKGRKVQYPPSHIMELIYKKMLETAQSHGGAGIQDTVLTVPSDFSVQQRNLISEAATRAGFNILRIINEPSAALLAHDIGQNDPGEHFTALVYRLGGTSHDATVVEVEHGMYRIISSVTDNQFGGDKFTTVLQDFLTTEFNRQFRCDMRENKRSVIKLGLAAERCKHALSTMITAQCAVDSLFDGCDFHYTMSRARLESLCMPLMARCTSLIERALKEVKCGKEDIAKVVICGGGAKPPVVRKAISDFLSASTISNSIPEDEVIAIGAAKEAAILVGGSDSKKTAVDKETVKVNFDMLPASVCVRIGKDELEVVLPRHSIVPISRQHTLTLASAQTAVAMEIYEAKDPVRFEDAELVAKVVMRDLPAGSTIRSNFHITREKELHVSCHETTTDRTENVTIPCH